MCLSLYSLQHLAHYTLFVHFSSRLFHCSSLFSNASLVFLNCSLSHPLIWDLISLHVAGSTFLKDQAGIRSCGCGGSFCQPPFLSSIGTTCQLSPKKTPRSSKLPLNVIQRFCHSQCTKERSSRKCLPQSDCQSVPILRIMKMREALKILSLQLFSSRAISSYVSSKLSESPWKSVWQDWHAVIKPRWSWITHTGPMAGSQNSPPQGCLALQQNTLTSAISHRIGIPKTHQTR